jgi:hypothetical protein
VSFAAIILCVASQRVFVVVVVVVVISLSTQSGNLWIYPRTMFVLVPSAVATWDTRSQYSNWPEV